MPKVTISPTKEAETQKTRQFKALIAAKLILLDIKRADLIKKLGMGRTNGYEKLADPRKLKYPEMVRLASLLKFTPEEKGAIL